MVCRAVSAKVNNSKCNEGSYVPSAVYFLLYCFSSPGSAMVSFWDSAMSTIFKEHLQNYCAESNEILSEAPLWWGTQTIFFISSLFWFPWQPKEKSLKKYLKIFSKTTGQILLKLYQKHQCDMGSNTCISDLLQTLVDE